MRSVRRALWFRAMLLFALAIPLGRPTDVFALATEDKGNGPLLEANYGEWPAGIMPVINHESRVYHTWVNGNEHFYYRGNAAALNDMLEKFAGVRLDVKEVVFLPGPADVRTFDREEVACDWQLHLLTGLAGHDRPPGGENEVGEKNPTMTVFVGGGNVRLDEVKIPEGITFIDATDLRQRYIKGLKSNDSKVRGTAGLALAELEPYNKANVSLIAGLLDERDASWKAAKALERMGRNAMEALPALERALKDQDERGRERFAEVIGHIQSAKDTTAAAATHRQILREIATFRRVLEPAEGMLMPIGEVRLTVQMDDGSRITGTPELEAFDLHWASGGELKAAVEDVQSIEFGEDHKTVKIVFRNEDSLKGTLDLAEIHLETLFGKVSLATDHIARIVNTSVERSDIFCNPNNGHWYALIRGELTWQQAMVRAQNLGWRGMRGHLATLTTLEENDWILKNMDFGRASETVWIGGFQRGGAEPAGGWQWVTGEPWSWANWGPNEPSNTGRGEDCLELRPNVSGLWNDVPESKVRCLIVEFDPDTPEAPPSWSVELDDGSRIVGIPTLKVLKVHNALIGNVEVPLERITSVEYSEDHKTAKVEGANGDILQVTIDCTDFEVKTLFGDVRLPAGHVVRMTSERAPPFGKVGDATPPTPAPSPRPFEPEEPRPFIRF